MTDNFTLVHTFEAKYIDRVSIVMIITVAIQLFGLAIVKMAGII